MGDQNAADLISLPQGGGALAGIGETFQPDLHTGTVNLSIPLPLPPGRRGLQPTLALAYSTGNPNGPFGLGWSLSLPQIRRRTSQGIPRYVDTGETADVFVLSGAEDLVPVPASDGSMRYRPRTESAFARITHVSDPTLGDYWEVRSKDGLRSLYGTPTPREPPAAWSDPATIVGPAGIFAWLISETVDLLGNRIQYTYQPAASGGRMRYLSQIQYADYGDPADPAYLVCVAVDYDEARPDPFSDRRPGFELRTTQRARTITITTQATASTLAKSIDVTYADENGLIISNGVSLLSTVTVTGHDGDTTEQLPPLELGYTEWQPDGRRLRVLSGELPLTSLGAPGLDLVDLFGDGRPCILQLNGAARYWRNRGDGTFDPPRTLAAVPAGIALGAPGVQMADMDGDGRPDLLVSTPTATGYWPLQPPPADGAGGAPAGFDPAGYVAARTAPTVSLSDPSVRLIDLDGDGRVDVLRAGPAPIAAYNDGHGSFGTVQVLDPPDGLGEIDFSDPRVKLADMTGDGLTDIVLLHSGAVRYWPNLGYGNFGERVDMNGAPDLSEGVQYDVTGFDPKRLLLGDVVGDGSADLVYVGDGHVTVWVNQSGNGFGEPDVIAGTPRVSNASSLRLADIDGAGVSGVLWTADAIRPRAPYAFLDPTGGVKPYLLNHVDNHRGATTSMQYATSTSYAEADRAAGEPWQTTLPFPVHVFASSETRDEFSGTVLTSAFSYHEGYWDPADREFRGFGRVEQIDTLTPTATATAAQPAMKPLDPLTPPTSVPSAFDPTLNGNLLQNWSFDEPGTEATQLVTTADHPWGGGPAAAPEWSTWNNAAATTTTDLRPSTLPQGTGGAMLHVTTDAPGCGLVQAFLPEQSGPTVVVASVWLYIVKGAVAVGTGDGGNTGQDVTCDQTGQWMLVSAGNGRSPANEFIVYAASPGGAEFFVDHAWIRAPDIPSTPIGSPPTRTVTWFHLGPVGPATGDWTDLDPSPGYWAEDPPLLPYVDMTAIPGDLHGPALRESLRGLRGRILRSELYGDDGDPVYGDRPYQVHDASFQVVPVLDGRDITDPSWLASPVITAREVLTRTATWDRGSDPMTHISATGEFDEYGRAHATVELGVPRDRDPRTPGAPCLAKVTTTDYATLDNATVYCIDRACSTSRHEAIDPGDGAVTDFVATALAGSANGELRGLEFSYYDGDPFTGLEPGQLGDHGLLVRTEHLVITPDRLTQITEPAIPGGTTSTIPPYLPLDGSPPAAGPWDGYRMAFQDSVVADAPVERGPHLGYVWHDAVDPYVAGYYAQSSRLCYDVQAPVAGRTPRGLELVSRSAYGGDSTTGWDDYDLLPSVVTNPVGLQTSAAYDYRILKPNRVTDPNMNVTQVGYTPLGLTAWIARLGKDSEQEGDTAEQPGQTFQYDLTGYDDSAVTPLDRQPLSVTTIRRVDHRWTLVNQENAARAASGQPALTDAEIAAMFGPGEPADHFIRTVEFTDGSGRLLQTRTQADDLALLDVGLPDDLTPAATVVTAVPSTADSPRVIVGGWKVYDNKGRTIITYEPFFDEGYGYQPPEAIPLDSLASTQQHYDPRGRPTVTVAPDSSQTRVVYGIPPGLTDPSVVAPTPWETYTYDANDNAGRTHPTLSLDIVDHWDTPSSALVDALGRAVETIKRGLGTDLVTSQTYDIDGRVTSVTDPLGRLAAATIYDYAGKPWLSWLLDAGSTQTIHDAADGIVGQRDDKHALTFVAFDPAHRPTLLWAADRASQNPTLRQLTIYGDDRAGSGLSEADAIAANARGKAVIAYDEAGSLTTPDYDLDGNTLTTTRQILRPELLLSLIPASGQWANTAYGVDWEPANGQTLDQHAAGLLDPTAYQTDAIFDALGRRTAMTAPLDATNQRAAIAFTYGRGGEITQTAVDGTPHVQQVIYDPHGRRSAVYLGNGVLLRYLYDSKTLRLRRLYADHASLAATTWTSDGPALEDHSFQYDLNGNLLTLGDRTPGSGLPLASDPIHSPDPNALNRRFTYDPLDRLVGATGRETDIAPNPPWLDIPRSVDVTQARGYTETYAYDDVGNMQELHHGTSVPEGAYTRTYTTLTASNRLQSIEASNSNHLAVPYTYDASGNLLTEAANRYFEWDHANRLATLRDQAGPQTATVYAQYRYDRAGNRVVKVVHKSAGPDEVTVYVGGLDRVLLGTVGGALTAYDNLHLTDRGAQLVTLLRGNALPDDALAGKPVRYQVHDHLSSVIATLDDVGTVLNREEYLPYGETSFGSYSRKRYRYTGKERDSEGGLSYHGSRYYAVWLARWLSLDPDGLPGRNPYSYGVASPLRWSDPTGRTDQDKSSPPVPATDHVAEGGGGSEGPTQLELIQQTKFRQPVTATAAGRGIRQWLRNAYQSLANEWQYGKVDVGHEEPHATTRAGETSRTFAQRFGENRSLGATEDKAAAAAAKAAGEFARVKGIDTTVVKGTRYGQPKPLPDLVPEIAPKGFASVEGVGGVAGGFLMAWGIYSTGKSLTAAYSASREQGSLMPLARTAAHESGTWGGGFAGGFLAGAAVGLETGPGAVATGLIGGFAGGYVGGKGASAAFDTAVNAKDTVSSFIHSFDEYFKMQMGGPSPWQW